MGRGTFCPSTPTFAPLAWRSSWRPWSAQLCPPVYRSGLCPNIWFCPTEGHHCCPNAWTACKTKPEKSHEQIFTLCCVDMIEIIAEDYKCNPVTPKSRHASRIAEKLIKSDNDRRLKKKKKRYTLKHSWACPNIRMLEVLFTNITTSQYYCERQETYFTQSLKKCGLSAWTIMTSKKSLQSFPTMYFMPLSLCLEAQRIDTFEKYL